MIEKLVVQKPIVWNAHGYRRPAGSRSSNGFVGDNGYGHEEWNGNPSRVWRRERVFHTQSKPRMDQYAEDGRLGIIMTAYREGRPFVVGAAMAVTRNTPEQMRAIAKALDFEAEAESMWREVRAIREAFGRQSDFDRHWRKACLDMPWRAPSEYYAWFDEPIPIDFERTFGGARREISKMHSACMHLRPDQAVSMIESRLPQSSPLLRWLNQGDFSRGLKGVANATAPKAARLRRREMPSGQSSAASASYSFVRYFEAHEVKVDPRHTELQTRFRKHVERLNPIENTACVDIRFSDPTRGLTLCEVKPCDPRNARYAIRLAMGQLLDYRQYNGPAQLMIVLGARPESDSDISLAIENNFAIAWPTRRTWQIEWP